MERCNEPIHDPLCRCLFEVVRDLEEVYGNADHGVVQGKMALTAYLATVRMIETPE